MDWVYTWIMGLKDIWSGFSKVVVCLGNLEKQSCLGKLFLLSSWRHILWFLCFLIMGRF